MKILDGCLAAGAGPLDAGGHLGYWMQRVIWTIGCRRSSHSQITHLHVISLLPNADELLFQRMLLKLEGLDFFSILIQSDQVLVVLAIIFAKVLVRSSWKG